MSSVCLSVFNLNVQCPWRWQNNVMGPHMECVTCHMSHVACHMSHVTCHMSDITFKSSGNAQYLIFVLQKSLFNSGSSCVEVGSLDQAQLRMKKKTKVEKFPFLRITLAIQYILGYNFFFFWSEIDEKSNSGVGFCHFHTKPSEKLESYFYCGK